MFNNLMTGTNKILGDSIFEITSLEIGISRKLFSTDTKDQYGNYIRYSISCKNVPKILATIKGKVGVMGTIYLNTGGKLYEIQELYTAVNDHNEVLEDIGYTVYINLLDWLSKKVVYNNPLELDLYYVYNDDTLISNNIIQNMYNQVYNQRWNTLGYMDIPKGFLNSINITNTGTVNTYVNNHDWPWEEEYIEILGRFGELSGGQLNIIVSPMGLMKTVEEDYNHTPGVNVLYSVEAYNAITKEYDTVVNYDNMLIRVGDDGSSLSKTYTLYLDDVDSDNPYSEIRVEIYSVTNGLRMKSSEQKGDHVMFKGV